MSEIREMQRPYVLDVDSCAKLSSVSKITVYRWAQLPGFPVIKSGKKLLIPTQEFLVWLNQHCGKQLFDEKKEA